MGGKGPKRVGDRAIRVEGLTRRFGRRWALRRIDLEVARGSVVAVLGANGTGKTTLLRVLATLLRPTAGRVEVLGHPLPEEGGAVRRCAGLLTPVGHAYEELTGLENLRFAARMSGAPADDGALREALEAVGLGPAADVRARAYSAGMRKRLELARLGLRSLDLLLLDEPYVSLDTDGIALVHAATERWRAAGATVLIASHQVEDALRHADRAVLLAAGRVEREGPAEALRGAIA